MRLAWGHTGWALLLLLPAFVRAQAVPPSQADSLAGDSLTLAAFAERVLLYHPIVRQARLLPDQARAQIRMARGNFDPAVGWTFNEKRRKNKHYYTDADGYLKVPVWWNVDIKAGVERGFGQFIDSQNANEPSNPIAPTTGIYYAGVSIPVGRGLLFDERRRDVVVEQLLDLWMVVKVGVVLLDDGGLARLRTCARARDTVSAIARRQHPLQQQRAGPRCSGHEPPAPPPGP